MKYIDEASSLKILNMDTGLAEKPDPNWNVISPKNGDLAKVGDKEYVFRNGSWEEA